MPDEDQLYLHHSSRCAVGARPDLVAIADDLAFMNAQLIRIPRRADFIRVGIWIALGLAVLAIIEVEMFWRYVRLLEAQPRRLRAALARGGAYRFGGGGSGSRGGSGLNLARTSFSVRMRGDSGYLSLSMVCRNTRTSASVSSSV